MNKRLKKKKKIQIKRKIFDWQLICIEFRKGNIEVIKIINKIKWK